MNRSEHREPGAVGNPSMAAPWRLFWLLVLGFHAAAAASWWWLMPGGFPPTHPSFWANRVAPIAVLAVVATAVAASRQNRVDLLRTTLGVFPAAWVGAALAARVIFPITFGRLFVLPLLAGLVMGVAAALTLRRPGLTPRRTLRAVAVVAVAAGIGASLPLCERAGPPDTRPLDPPMREDVAGADLAEQSPVTWSDSRLRVHPGDGSLTVKAGTLTLSVHPILRFISRSPDGCWTILAPRGLREGPDPFLRSSHREGGRLVLRYRADDEATLQIEPSSPGSPILLEAMTRLPSPVYSHLNSFCDLRVSGHGQLSLSFSPCPGTLIAVQPADYPAGRPLRLAYRDASDGFHVVEATDGEKGPFRELAGGRLGRSDPLAITLHDQETPLARVVLEDWSAQAGTSLSPTAGWGIPVNAIEFSLEDDTPRAPASIFFTLAGTSVGRGWDSVGHRPGTYRNRMRIEVLETSPRKMPENRGATP